jgi:hypothetical protein
VEPEVLKCLEMISSLNTEADSIYELYNETNTAMGPGTVWNDIVLSPSRSSDVENLRESILKIEKTIKKQ